MRVELHCHSTCSDGSDPAAEVGRRAASRDLGVFCLTDHDTCAGYADAAAAVPELAIRGVEVSCTEDGRTVHVLCYDAAGDARWAAVEARLAELAEARMHRVRVIGANLRMHFGLDVDVAPIVAAAAHRVVGRPDVAAALIAQGLVGSRDEAFRRYLKDGGPGDPPHRRVSIAELLELVRGAGGRAALAHPHLYADRAATWFERHRDAGLDGLEAHYGHYGADDRARWRDFARARDLVATGGSDWHGPGTAPDLGVEIPDDDAARLLTWLGR
ncbi:MAG: PHP domain-containing protein [Kofleriaceae bacterium]|nr:PHP domain-containing protein [Myxococcales bacterium]MCB9559857.1 PHP domain-containing protein [Kofleriaceae bacterium]MCB9571469.1 PHP domain-containing protein [Kofleriaceae bacterium]